MQTLIIVRKQIHDDTCGPKPDTMLNHLRWCICKWTHFVLLVESADSSGCLRPLNQIHSHFCCIKSHGHWVQVWFETVSKWPTWAFGKIWIRCMCGGAYCACCQREQGVQATALKLHHPEGSQAHIEHLSSCDFHGLKNVGGRTNQGLICSINNKGFYRWSRETLVTKMTQKKVVKLCRWLHLKW